MGDWYQRTYPPQGRVLCDGGLATKYSPAIIPDDHSPDCANVLFDNGAVGTRGGTTALASSVGSHAIQGLYTRHDNDGTEDLLTWASTKMYILSGSAFTSISAASGLFVSGGRIGATEYENYIFVGQSGVTNPYKYNDSFSYHGIYTPVSAATVVTSTSGTGTASGVYYYKVSWVNSGLVEGNVTSASTAVTIASQPVSVYIPTASSIYGVARRKIYRTMASSGISGTYYLLDTVTNNTATIYNDVLPDASLGAAAPTDNGVPPQWSVAKAHQNRIFCNDVTNGNFLYYSNLANPYVFASTNFLRIGDNASDLIRSIEVFDNGLVVFCQRGVYIVYMPDTDDANWVVVKARTSLGSGSPYGCIAFENKIMFPASQAGKFVGFATLQGDTIEPSATFLTVSVAGSELQSDVIEADMFNVQQTYLPNLSAISFKNRLYFALTYNSGNTTNNRIYVYDYSISNLSKRKRGAWVPYTGLNASQFTIYNGLLYYGESTGTGLVKQLETTSYNDNGSAIDSYWMSKDFSGLKPEEDLYKDFRTLQVLVDKAGSYFMNLYTVVDADDSDGDLTTIDLSNDAATWNSFVWGTGVWGAGNFREDYRIFLGKKRGKAISFKFSNQNTANQRFKVHGLRFTYNIKGRR